MRSNATTPKMRTQDTSPGRRVGLLRAVMVGAVAAAWGAAGAPPSAAAEEPCVGSPVVVCTYTTDGTFTIPSTAGEIDFHLVGGEGGPSSGGGDDGLGGLSVQVDAQLDGHLYPGDVLAVQVGGNGGNPQGGAHGGGDGACGTYVPDTCGGGGGGASSVRALNDPGLGLMAVSPGGGGAGGGASQRNANGTRAPGRYTYAGGNGGDGGADGGPGPRLGPSELPFDPTWDPNPGGDGDGGSTAQLTDDDLPLDDTAGAAGCCSGADADTLQRSVGTTGQGGAGEPGANGGANVCGADSVAGTGAGGGGGGGGYVGGGGGGGANVYKLATSGNCDDSDEGTYSGGGGAGGSWYISPKLQGTVGYPCNSAGYCGGGYPTQDPPVVVIAYGPGVPTGNVFERYRFQFPHVDGGTYTISNSNDIPPGLHIDPDGTLTGVPTQPGTYHLDILFRSADGKDTAWAVDLTITELPPTVPGLTVHGIVGSLNPNLILNPVPPSGIVFHFPDSVAGTVSDRLTLIGSRGMTADRSAALGTSARAGGRLLAHGSTHLQGTGRGTLRLSLTKLGRRLLGHGRTHKHLQLSNTATLTVGGKHYQSDRRLAVTI